MFLSGLVGKLVEVCEFVPVLLTYFLGICPSAGFCNGFCDAVMEHLFAYCHDTCRDGCFTFGEGGRGKSAIFIQLNTQWGSPAGGPELVVIIWCASCLVSTHCFLRICVTIDVTPGDWLRPTTTLSNGRRCLVDWHAPILLPEVCN